jgi:hypothetical protein
MGITQREPFNPPRPGRFGPYPSVSSLTDQYLVFVGPLSKHPVVALQG